jgi:hypothetical protein
MRLNQSIDATKYDIRVLWTGVKEEHVSSDAGVVEGYPLDPPDAGKWQLVEFGVETTKDADRYWTLWIREKGRAKGRPKKKPAASAAPVALKEKKPRTRKPRATAPEEPSTVLGSVQSEPETN